MLLVRTPSPHPTESLLGYVLRISETNGYESQSDVLGVAGISWTNRRRMMDIEIGKLARVLGKQVSELSHLVYSARLPAKMEWLILGRPVVGNHLRLAKPMFCPRCVSERGFMEALWDSALVVACPRHRCGLLSACPGCGTHLGNLRKGLLTCRCGESLLNGCLPAVSDETADLMGVLASKIVGSPPPAGYASGLPVAELLKMSLRTLQVVILSLGRQQLMIECPNREHSTASLVDAAALALRDWPTNFYGLIRRVGERSAKEAPYTTRFLKRHQTINGALFKKRLPPEEIRFLREAFARYGMEEWGESIVRFRQPALNGLPVDKKLLTRSEIAAHLGVSRMTVTKLQKNGRLSIKRYETGSTSVVFAERTEIGLPPAGPGRSLGGRNASRYIGLPVSVLKNLRQSGVFEIRRLATPLSAYHEADLKAFSELLIRRAMPPSRKGAKTAVSANKTLIGAAVPLRDVTKHARFLSVSGSAGLIHALLDGQIKAVGMKGDSAGDLLIRLEDVRPLISASRRDAFGATRSAKEASLRLECDSTVIPNLVTAGLLKSVSDWWGNRICEKSLDEFSADYISLASIGRELAVPSRSLIRMCDQTGLPLLRVPRRNPELPQPFLAREHEQSLRRLAAEYRPRRAKA